MTKLSNKDRQVLMHLASGLSDEEIAQKIGLPKGTVESVLTCYQRWLKRHLDTKWVTREAMALYVVDNVLTPEERQEWTDLAQQDRQLLQDRGLLTEEVVKLLDYVVKPEYFGLSFTDLGLLMKVDKRDIQNTLRPASLMLGSRIRLQVSFYLLVASGA